MRHVLLSGCSGGGKSAILAELDRRGFATVPEPGRRIIEDELRGSGIALPWVNMRAFAERAIDVAAADRKRVAEEPGWVFFDRGLVDAAVALEHVSGRSARETLASFDRYHETVFLVPPWPEIYQNDDERKHGLSEAIAEYERLVTAYNDLGYSTIILPKTSVDERADYILGCLAK
ncbi:AAA family ATPase [Altericroceibacterium endophyticum]|uniref:AAA family ATPase n=1 Tax=Altericroceibacterium endophyticum TaxID=1808508 RepID=A0A6I4T8M2_9SPHN|nr:AAA family ATPase [Altericroceibacterium endophyticum]